MTPGEDFGAVLAKLLDHSRPVGDERRGVPALTGRRDNSCDIGKGRLAREELGLDRLIRDLMT